jgi:hypothetical protein
MPGTATLTIVGLVVAVVLISFYLKLRARDVIDAHLAKLRANAKLVSRADYVEGAEKIPVAIGLSDTAFFYQNGDLEASFDLDRLDEIEYDDDLATGRSHAAGCRVLRLRSHGAAFEFLLDKADCAKWTSALPARTYGHTATAHAV